MILIVVNLEQHLYLESSLQPGLLLHLAMWPNFEGLRGSQVWTQLARLHDPR